MDSTASRRGRDTQSRSIHDSVASTASAVLGTAGPPLEVEHFSPEQWEALAREVMYSAQRLASRLEMSPRNLQRLFKSRFRETPQKWLDRCRLQEAKRLLRASKSVKEVAFELGFARQSHFCRKFKAQFGYTPSSVVENGTQELRRYLRGD